MRTVPFHRVVYELLFLGFLKALRQFTFLFPFSNIYMDEEYREHLHRQWKKFIAQVFWEKKKREIEKKKWSKKKKGKMLKVHYFFKGEVICLFFPSLCAACLLLECVSSTSISWRGLDGSTVWAIPGISEFKNKLTLIWALYYQKCISIMSQKTNQEGNPLPSWWEGFREQLLPQRVQSLSG